MTKPPPRRGLGRALRVRCGSGCPSEPRRLRSAGPRSPGRWRLPGRRRRPAGDGALEGGPQVGDVLVAGVGGGCGSGGHARASGQCRPSIRLRSASRTREDQVRAVPRPLLPEGVAALNSATAQVLAGGQWFQLWRGEVVSIHSPEFRGFRHGRIHRGPLVDRAPQPRNG